jgi:hypothetical protein
MSFARLLMCSLFVAGAAAGTTAASAANGWDEATQGDFANLGTAPTPITLGVGSNLILGTSGRSAGVVDRDYFTFTLPAGWQLDSITLLPGSTFIGASGLGFIAVQGGTQVTMSPTSSDPSVLLGWHHTSENDIGTDVLGLIGLGAGAIGFSGPLQAGSYAFWAQETATGSATYRYDFNVSVVPEPAAPLLMAAGLAALAALRKRR